MAGITARDNSSILKISRWLGLNEAQDGDTNIKAGELSALQNMKITREGHLQKRAGTKTLLDINALWSAYTGTKATTPEYSGMWNGYVAGKERFLIAYGGVVWNVDFSAWTAAAIGELTQDTTTFFGFSEKVYILNGHEYKYWDGTTFGTVTGYIPIVKTACAPDGTGTMLQQVNKLNGFRKVKFSPDGTATTFYLPEKNITSVVSVNDETASQSISIPTYTSDLTAGSVTFASAIAKGTNTISITYQSGTGDRALVEGMKYACVFNGSTDNRVFIYGDGTNKTLYSDLKFDGEPSAEYFPDLNEMEVGDSNTPVKALVRHFSRLLCFKSDSAYSVQYGTTTLDDGIVTAAYYVLPVNNIIGCESYDAARNMENNPVTVCAGAVYQWKSTNTSGNITRDERTAKRISDRVEPTLSGFDLSNTKTFNYLYDHEMYFISNGNALVYNYAVDAWYYYPAFPADALIDINDKLYSFNGGKIKGFSREYRGDDGADISIYAETGSMPFDRDYVRKYCGVIWVSIKPESGAKITVTTESNRNSDYAEKTIVSSLSTFAHMNFAHFSFATNRKPQVKRARIKVNRCTYYKLIFKDTSALDTCTVLSADIKLQYLGWVK